MIRRLFCVSTIGLLAWTQTSAQIYVGGGDGMFIKSGSTFTADSMSLSPSADLALTNITLQQSNTPAQGIGGYSISQLYTLSAPISFQGTIGLFYNPLFLNGNTAATLQLAYRDTATGSWLPASSSSVNTGTSYVSNTFASPVQLSALTAASAGVVLPISLLNFTAKPEGPKVRLDFTINLQAGNGLCIIERSGDGKHFEQLQQMDLTNGEHPYNSYDSRPLQGLNYYRLGWQDETGKKEYSMIRMVFMAEAASQELSFFPVPAGKELHLSLAEMPKEGSYIQLSSLDGRIILKKAIITQSSMLDISNYAAGTYLLSFYNGSILQHYKIEKH